MFDKNELEQCLAKINIQLYDCDRKTRNVIEVIESLSKIWDVLSDSHKQKIYDAMGIVPPSQPKQPYTGIRGGCDDGIAYLKNQPTCDDSLLEDIRNGNDLSKYL